jgi:hypothetical protein
MAGFKQGDILSVRHSAITYEENKSIIKGIDFTIGLTQGNRVKIGRLLL